MRKVYADIIFYVLFFGALFIMLIKEYLKNNNGNETVQILNYVVIGLMLGALIVRIVEKVFPKWFNNKPTREEIEEKMFGK
jgi:hypothetical protein